MKKVIDDNTKRQLLDDLSKESTMVLSTAYAYAKNYVLYGEDITKPWTTAVQQASILEQVKMKAWAEGYDYFKKNYENRLKADMLAMLTDIQLEIKKTVEEEKLIDKEWANGLHYSEKIIQQKINLLKSESEERK